MPSSRSTSPPRPPASSAPSFVYPVKSLLTGIQPAGEGQSQDTRQDSPPTVSISTSSSPSISRRSRKSQSISNVSDLTKSGSNFSSNTPSKSRKRRSSKLSRSISRSQDEPSSNFRHFPGEEQSDTSSLSLERHPSVSSSGGTLSPRTRSSTTSSSITSPSSPTFDDTETFSTSPSGSFIPVYDPKHPPALPAVAQEAFMARSESLLPQDSWNLGIVSAGLPQLQEEVVVEEEQRQETVSEESSQRASSEKASGGEETDDSLPWNPSELGFVHLPPLPSSPSISGSSVGGSRSRTRSIFGGSSTGLFSSRSNSEKPDSINQSMLGMQPASSGSEGLPSSEVSEGSSLKSTLSDIPLLTIRFKHIEVENGHHILTGREGKLLRCEDEPIRAPGAVQGFGVLIVLEELEDTLLVRQVSENSTTILGLPPAYLFSLECFTDVLPVSQATLLWDTVQFLIEPEPTINAPGAFVHPNAGLTAKMNSASPEPFSAEKEDFAPHVFLLSGWGAPGTAPPVQMPTSPDLAPPEPTRKTWTAWCAIHRPPPSPYPVNNTSDGAANAAQSEKKERNLIIMEFELEPDVVNPLYPPPGTMPAAATNPGSAGSSGTDSSGSFGGGSSDSSGFNTSSGSGTDGSQQTLVSTIGVMETPVVSSEDITPTVSMEGKANSSAIFIGPESSQKSGSVSPSASKSSDGKGAGSVAEGSTANMLGPLEPRTQSVRQVNSESSGSTAVTGSPFSVDGDEAWAPSAEAIMESTTSYSRPLLALERLRKLAGGTGTSPAAGSPASAGKRLAQRASRGRGASHSALVSGAAGFGLSQPRPASGAGMMDVFAVISQMNEQLGAAPDLETFLKVAVGLIKDLTQFHRVLAYQFDESFNGQAVAELVDWSQTRDLYRGLHFPKSDIPQQARELYMINKVRILYDRSQTTARIVARSREDLEEPINMTHCYLRAMSPIHLKYLGNMGVRASMSVTIMAFGALWGLIACHSYGPHGMRVSFPVRQMLRLLSQSISRNIERLSYAQRLHTRKLINTISSDHHPTGYIVSNADDLLSLFDADFGILVVGEGAKILGPNQHGQEILIIAEYLRLKQFTTIQVSQAVTSDFPDLQLSTGLEVIAGLLYVPLSSGGQDFVALLRKGQLRSVHWAGRPFKPEASETAMLEPRKSFKIWSETVAGRCRAWSDEQLETAGVLALVYGKFIEVWRQKETALQTTKLTNLLLSNARHEVRTPLNHIINCLEMALNGPLDLETRDNLSRSHVASKNLLFTINDLLDLARLESGNTISFNEPFDLAMAIQEALHSYKSEADRRNLEFTVDVSQCPRFVVGDSKKIKTVVQNLTANALKYTSSGSIKVICTPYDEPEGLRSGKQTAVEIVVSDTGCGIPPDRLESIFREFEQVESAEPKTSSEPGVGLGLAVVARIVEQLGGQLRVESQVDQGSRFSFLMSLSLFGETSENQDSGTSSTHSSRASLISASGSSSMRSGVDVDSFVEALSSNHMEASRYASYENLDQKALPPPQSPKRGNIPGSLEVTDSQTPLRAVKVDKCNISSTGPLSPSSISPSRIELFPTISSIQAEPEQKDAVVLRVLIVEDDDINRAILAKRLRLDGYMVVGTTNGQEGLDKIKTDREFDCVLMDINMPILNGFESAERIRELEKSPDATPGAATDRLSHKVNGRIPIFAVSASLLETQRKDLQGCGMDGWILKPIDHKRLKVILQGVTDLEKRSSDLYRPGYNWELGGWFGEEQTDP